MVNFQMLSDGRSLVFLEPTKDITIITSEFFISSLILRSDPQVIEVSSLGQRCSEAIYGFTETRLTLELILNGPVQYKEGGIIRSIFDLYSVRDLLTQVEKKVNRRH